MPSMRVGQAWSPCNSTAERGVADPFGRRAIRRRQSPFRVASPRRVTAETAADVLGRRAFLGVGVVVGD